MAGAKGPVNPSLWRVQALCRGIALDVFFLTENEALALKYCKKCKVVAECRAFISKHEHGKVHIHGVFGGTTPMQRLQTKGSDDIYEL